MKSIAEHARELLPLLIEIRRELHRFPEVSFKEHQTTRLIGKYLTESGIEIIPWGGQTGVVGLLRGENPGPVIALRADIDALPIQEENEIEYRSQIPGVMHACGHDVHTVCVLGAAFILSKMRSDLTGTVKFIFQPAEEINAGAKEMVKMGVLKNPDVDVIFGLHNNPNLAVGQIGLKEGPLMAAVDTTFLNIIGRGGHGAIPHKSRDPIMAAAAIIMALQTVVSRQIDPLDPAVISFGTIHGGHANNVIPDRVELTGTVRTFSPALRARMPELMRSVILNTAAAMNTDAEFIYREDLPAVVNPPELTEWCRAPLRKIVGDDGLISPTPSMGGEDFAIYQEKVPGVFLWLGVGNVAKGIVHQWHSPRFQADEKSLQYGAGALAQLAFDYASSGLYEK
ncbi:MAG: amidohydrolase [Thermoanaerobacteraceae bacterium]|nr:amidohydrolase [Thermoanaerobacteraceae bacterium]